VSNDSSSHSEVVKQLHIEFDRRNIRQKLSNQLLFCLTLEISRAKNNSVDFLQCCGHLFV